MNADSEDCFLSAAGTDKYRVKLTIAKIYGKLPSYAVHDPAACNLTSSFYGYFTDPTSHKRCGDIFVWAELAEHSQSNINGISRGLWIGYKAFTAYEWGSQELADTFARETFGCFDPQLLGEVKPSFIGDLSEEEEDPAGDIAGSAPIQGWTRSAHSPSICKDTLTVVHTVDHTNTDYNSMHKMRKKLLLYEQEDEVQSFQQFIELFHDKMYLPGQEPEKRGKLAFLRATHPKRCCFAQKPHIEGEASQSENADDKEATACEEGMQFNQSLFQSLNQSAGYNLISSGT